MSRSYHINRRELERLKKEKVSYSSTRGKYILLKRKKGELDQKRHIKKTVQEQRNAKKIIEKYDFDWINNAEIETARRISDTYITWHDDPSTIYPVSEDDVSWILKNFSSLNTLKVRSIHFINIDEYDEIVPGVWVPVKAYGQYNTKSDKIKISGLRIEDSGCSFLEHILFYYKVMFISVLSHEIFHSIDFNSLKYRKGQNNMLKNSDIEEFASTLQADFYERLIIPYIKDKYSKEYNEFLSWMEEQGVLPLELEYWNPAVLTNGDGFPLIFNKIHNSIPQKELNLSLADEMCFCGFIDKALEYYEYILLTIDSKDYHALRGKALTLTYRTDQYQEADSIFKSIYDPELRDEYLTLGYAKTKRKLKQYKEALQLYSLYTPLSDWALLEYVQCLHFLNQQDDINNIIEGLRNGHICSHCLESRINLYLISIYSIQQNYHEAIKYFKLINEESYWYDLLWAKILAGKIYIVLKDYKSAKQVLSNPGNTENYPYYGIEMVERMQNMLKKIESKNSLLC